jgi:hypothetical protein
MDSDDLAMTLNAACECSGADIDRLRSDIEQAVRQSLPQAALVQSHPHLFSSVPVFLTDDHAAQMKKVIAAIEQVVRLPAYHAQALAQVPDIARVANASRGAFLGYDFHITQQGPRLIEINTNAGGAILNLELLAAQLRCCDAAAALSDCSAPSALAAAFVEMFRQEWRLSRDTAAPGRVAIVDETPSLQYLYPEFLLCKQLLEVHGLTTVIADPAELELMNGRLAYHGEVIDLVYNRLTDFYLESAAHAHLRAAYLSNAAVFTPTPRNHALYADKRHLVVLSNAQTLRDLGADTDTIETLAQGVPPTLPVQAADAAQWWAQRKQWFFKPACGFGGRGVYRGDKLTRGVFEDILNGGYVAQALVPPSERQHPVNMPGAFKVDVRNYVYDGRVQLIASRLYKGQTTNFRTPGGGFAPVFFASEARITRAVNSSSCR